MRRTVWAVTPASVIKNLGETNWLELSDFEKCEVLATYMRTAVPGFLGRRFEYRVIAMGVVNEAGQELFMLETGTPEEFY